MIKIILCFSFFLFSISEIFSQVVVPLPVLDAPNLQQNILAAGRALESMKTAYENLKTAKESVELSIRNTLSPGFWIWDKVTSFDSNIEDLQNKFNSGDFEEYLREYYDVNYYKNSPCFKFGGCTGKEKATLKRKYEEKVEAMRKNSLAITKAADKYIKAYKKQVLEVQRLEKETKGAKGSLESTQYSNQWLSIMTKSLMELNTNMLALQNTLKVVIDVEYMGKALEEASTTQRENGVLDTSITPFNSRFNYLNLR